MSRAEIHALALRDLAVFVAKAKGVVTAPDVYSYHDARICIEYSNGKPQTLDVFRRGDLDFKVLSVIWNMAAMRSWCCTERDHGKIV
jgi:hypothetical protein